MIVVALKVFGNFCVWSLFCDLSGFFLLLTKFLIVLSLFFMFVVAHKVCDGFVF